MIFSSVTLDLVFVLFGIIGYIVYYYKKRYEYWLRLDVPFVGFSRDIFFSRKCRAYTLQDCYNELAPLPFGGIYQAAKPYLMIRDPELIRTILIKDFSHFTDRGIVIYEDLDPLNAHIFHLGGQRWKSIRTKMVPTFSSGKLKSMYSLMDDCTDTLNRYLEEKLKISSEIEVLELMVRFATDVIGTCAFGFNCNAISDEESEFRRIGRRMVPNLTKLYLRQAFRSIHPGIIPWLRWKGMDLEVEEFFLGVTRQTIKHRDENQHKRNDFIQLLINVQHEEQKALQAQNSDAGGKNFVTLICEIHLRCPVLPPLFTENVMTAQVFVFFLAGFETTAATLTFCLYELALNPEIMEKLHDEIQQVSRAHDGKLDYDALKEMRYMECVVSETLRKYPVVAFLDRVCTKSYELPNTSLLIKENTKVVIPVYALHMDPQYFPEPHRFNPDRFSEGNKSNIVPGTYLPFGDGPRICIGMRFAMMEMRAALSLIIKNYTVHPTAKTPIPMVFSKRSMLLNKPAGGTYLKFQKRVK